MKFFNKIFGNAKSNLNVMEAEPYPALRKNMFTNTSCININMYRANGGWVLEYRNIERRTHIKLGDEEPENTLHIIQSGEDIGKAIGQIINFELLRK